MHISLDSALGQQRRLNSVGESITQIAPDPAAAYSLRSLTGGDPKVVRVRRASDNHEQDFTASDVSSGALQDFVNAQVVAPLDIQALSATGRDGDFLIAKAAYSLRSLGTRQATLAATGDTVARANGKYVCQVRRDSDDALKSFTADEITDGTLLSFVGTGGSDNGFVKTWYDQSVTTQAGDTATGNHATQATAANQPKIVDAGSLNLQNTKASIKFDGTDDNMDTSHVLGATSTIFGVCQSNATSDILLDMRDGSTDGAFVLSHTSNSFKTRYNSTDLSGTSGASGLKLGSFLLKDGTQEIRVNGTSVGSGTASGTISVTATTQIGGRSFSTAASSVWDGSMSEIIIYDTDQTDNRTAIEANMGEVYSIDLPSGVDPGFDQVDGFVETWYDQSGNGRDAVQATAGSQPKIVDAGSLVTGGGIAFDGSDDQLDFTALNATDLAIFSVVKFDSVSGQERILGEDSTNGEGFGIGSATTGFFRANGGSSSGPALNATVSTSGDFLYSANRASNTLGFFTNGVASATATNSDAFKANSIGGSTNPIDGNLKEIIIYSSDQTSKRTTLEANIAAEYGITLS
jgi:hypothetical protein